MSRGNQLYDRPDLTQKFGKLALYVAGTLPGAFIDEAYEGRLQIHNAIGACSAELINGAVPPGGGVYVDNDTHEVVVTWPAYPDTKIHAGAMDLTREYLPARATRERRMRVIARGLAHPQAMS